MHHPATEVGHVSVSVAEATENESAEEHRNEDADDDPDANRDVPRDKSGDSEVAARLAGLLDLRETHVSEDDRGDPERKRNDPPNGERGDARDHGPQGELVRLRGACGGRCVFWCCHVSILCANLVFEISTFYYFEHD